MALATLSIDLVARLASTVQAAFGALAGAATAGAPTALVRNTLHAVDALNDVALYGVPAEAAPGLLHRLRVIKLHRPDRRGTQGDPAED